MGKTTEIASDPKSIGVLAKEAFRACGQDREAAENLLLKWIEDDDELMERVVRPLMVFAVSEHIRFVARRDRAQHLNGFVTGEDLEASVRALRRISEQNWYNVLLPSGVRLGDATRTDLKDAESFWRLQASSNLQRAEWVLSIWKRVRKGQTVRQALDVGQLEHIAASRR